MRKLILLLIVLAGCKQVPMLPGISAYKIDIQQGNYVTQDMVAKLKPGMSKSQVRFALGTPLVVDPFHSDRWDYIYVLQKGGRTVEQRRIIVVFEGDKLIRIDGDVVPSAPAATAERAPDTAKRGPSTGDAAPASSAGASMPAAAGASAVPEAAVEAHKPSP
jgi:outer membrane protein assembly factor BamE